MLRYLPRVREAAEIDVAIFGGGIAGLWLLNRLRTLGFDAALFEKTALGTGQTIASQGIIHSGVKYTFDGVNRPQTEALSSMPKIWMDCIEGRGEVENESRGECEEFLGESCTFIPRCSML